MNKKITVALVALTLLIPTTAHSASISNKTVGSPTIAILDTAIDMSTPFISKNIVYEACVAEWNSCPNGQGIQEGPGSATLPIDIITKNGFDHGTSMAALAIKENPNVKIVFVRIIGSNPQGLRRPAGEATVYNALSWVIANKDKFNIQAVSMSQGHHNLGLNKDYCPKTPITESKINELNAANIGVFFSAGNGRDYQRIDWPSCIPQSIAIGATMPTKEIAIYSNYDPNLLDFFAQGTIQSIAPGGKIVNVAGTSAATAIAATQWATIKTAKPNLSYKDIYDLISRTSIPTKNSKIPSGKLINLTGALNG